MNTTTVLRNALLFTTLAIGACGLGPDDGPVGDATASFDIQGRDCAGPFDCRLPNPGGHNANSNRYDVPGGNDNTWPILDGTHLRDAKGDSRAVITDSQVSINYGQRKDIDGSVHVFAFDVALDDGTHGSGWIRRAAVTDRRIDAMPDVAADDPHAGDYATTFHVTDANTGMYGTLKVVPNSTSTNEAASDYLARDGVVYLLYNLPGEGGVATDALPIGATFHRSLGVAAVDLPLYWRGGTERDASRPSIRFVYGHAGTRYGWIARAAIE